MVKKLFMGLLAVFLIIGGEVSAERLKSADDPTGIQKPNDSARSDD